MRTPQRPQYTVAEARLRAINMPRPDHLNAHVRWTNRLRFRAYSLTWRLRRVARLRRVLGLLVKLLELPPAHWTGPRWAACRALTERLTGQLDAIRRTLR